MSDISQLGLVRTNYCTGCKARQDTIEAQAAEIKRLREDGKVSAHHEAVATITEFGNELMFAVLGLETEPAGTKAVFEVTLRGRKRKVTVE